MTAPSPARSALAYPHFMVIRVNGEAHELPAGSSIPALLERLGLKDAACAVEVNRELVPKRQHAATELRDGDTIEVVTLVGGG